MTVVPREKLQKCRRVVVKAGTSMLADSAGRVRPALLRRLGEGVLELKRGGRSVVLVSSGAIAFGMQARGLGRRPRRMEELQACAAVGQGRLMHAYEQFFSRRGVVTAQVLLTRDGLEHRDRFLKARGALEALLRSGILPIVNENDTVATEEIAFGDNDVLSAQTAHLIGAELLVLLSDVDGFRLGDGSRVRSAGSVEVIDRELAPHLRDRRRETTVGGMRAKLEAAKLAMRLGVPLLLVNGNEPRVLARALSGEDLGTLFWPEDESRSARHKWIGFSAARKGVLIVDAGAREALLLRKSSLLPRGLISASGGFAAGDIVELEDPEGRVLGRGVARHSCAELALIAGKSTQEAARLLGRAAASEVVHRDDLVLWT